MYQYRITKYNPKYRQLDGKYLNNEWTSYSDIGKKYNGKLFTMQNYIEVENSYVTAIILFAVLASSLLLFMQLFQQIL